MSRTTTRNNGFTLIELAIVVFIVGVVLAVAFPRLLPTLIFSEHRAAARELGDYGRALMAKSALDGNPFTFYFDLDKQEYWTVRWVTPEPEELEGEVDPDYLNELSGLRRSGLSSNDLAALMARKRFGEEADLSGIDPDMISNFDQIDLAKAEQQYDDKFFKFSMRRTLARTENVKHEDVLEDVNLFSDEFSLEPEEEPVPEELADPVLRRGALSEGVYVAGMVVEGQYYQRGEVALEISPLGLSEKVWFHVVNQDGAYFTVFWNPINNQAMIYEGQRDFY